MKLYLRYDAQLHRHYRNCLKDLCDLQALRLPQANHPVEPIAPPKPPAQETETATPASEPEPEEPTLTPEQARLQYMQSEIQCFEEYQARMLNQCRELRPEERR